VRYEDKNIREDHQFVRELVGTYQSRTTPTVVIDGEVMMGFDPEQLDRMLGLIP
jgi:glutaredoxin